MIEIEKRVGYKHREGTIHRWTCSICGDRTEPSASMDQIGRWVENVQEALDDASRHLKERHKK